MNVLWGLAAGFFLDCHMHLPARNNVDSVLFQPSWDAFMFCLRKWDGR